MKRVCLNNKGYMLVEIVLASALAMVIAYFITDVTIKLKNKNDDLLVKTLASTDQAIIYNTIMKDLYNTSETIDCNYIDTKLHISGNTFEYNGFINIVTDYVTLSNYSCIVYDGKIDINIPITVEQLPDEDFNVNIIYGI